MGDLGYQLTFSYFDEASVSEWKGCDLRLAHDLPNIDLVVLPIRKVRTKESGLRINFSLSKKMPQYHKFAICHIESILSV